jgi:hypothetical protein
MSLTFAQPGLLNSLEAVDAATLDALRFGVIGMAPGDVVTIYNVAESRLPSLTPANVIGQHFFQPLQHVPIIS